jgi:hypothetical protein
MPFLFHNLDANRQVNAPVTTKTPATMPLDEALKILNFPNAKTIPKTDFLEVQLNFVHANNYRDLKKCSRQMIGKRGALFTCSQRLLELEKE